RRLSLFRAEPVRTFPGGSSPVLAGSGRFRRLAPAFRRLCPVFRGLCPIFRGLSRVAGGYFHSCGGHSPVPVVRRLWFGGLPPVALAHRRFRRALARSRVRNLCSSFLSLPLSTWILKTHAFEQGFRHTTRRG